MVQRTVCAFMTAPRYSNTWARNFIDSAFKPLSIPLRVSGGVFYGQCMQRMLEDAISEGVELGITVDFDSVFDSADVKRLLTTFESYQNVDALASLQSRRGMQYPLFTVGEKKQVEFKGEPLEVQTAHFGLTVIDLKKLAEVPRPWFQGVPDSDGGWGEGRVDDDIWFWKQWRKAGNSVYVDSGCSIGHLEEMVSCFDEEGRHQMIYPNQWRKEESDASKSKATA